MKSMADLHHHRPKRILLPSRSALSTSTNTPTTPSRSPYAAFPYTPSTPTPTPTPSKHRLLSSFKPATNRTTPSLSFLFLLLFSLRSLYSLLPFLRASPSSFSIFPFSFLVSLLSFLLTFSFTLFSTSSSSSKDPFLAKQNQPIFSLTSLTQSQHKLLFTKSLLLAVVFLLRFQALRYCGTSAMILAELSGNVAARFVTEGRSMNFNGLNRIGSGKIPGFIALFFGLFLLSVSWDRVECFPLSSINVSKLGFSNFLGENCVRVWPMLLPFLSGFLGCYERLFMNPGSMRDVGRKRVRLITLFYTTVVLVIPAVISMFVFEAEGDSISLVNLGWPLANTVVFGVLLSENYTDEKLSNPRDFQREYLVTFSCTLVLELFYFPELSLWGLLICGFLLWIAVRELDPLYSDFVQLGLESSDSFSTTVMKPLRHILSERKSRKIALFLLINTAYMVVEFAAGFMSNSLGLISDACHMLFDCAALAIGLYASYISRLPANGQFNYGRGRFEVLSGYVNAVFLVLVGALIVLESIERILDPQEVSTNSLLSVSIGGLLVNVVGLIFFHEEHHHAHGGSGSCSHSHSHSHSHSPAHHHDEVCDKHNKSISLVADNVEKSCSGHDKLCTGHEHHDSTNHHMSCNKGHHHNYGNQYDEHDHSHQHNHHDHHHNHHHHHSHIDNHVHGHTSEVSSIEKHGVYLESHEEHARHDSNHVHTEVSLDGKEASSCHDHHHIDHNMEGIFLHVLADTMGSVGVVISTLLIKFKGWLVADPACSIFISVLIVSSVIPLLRNSAEILLQRLPRAHEQDLKEALESIMRVKGVYCIQNLHVWSLTNTDVVGTLHLHVSAETDKASVKAQVSQLLIDAGIKDLTIQVEYIKSS